MFMENLMRVLRKEETTDMMNTKRNRKTVRFSLKKKRLLVFGCAAVLLCGTVGATIAWLMKDTGPVVNTFTVADVTTEVEEEFDGHVKKNVTAKNTGDIDAYIRIKLISYRVNESGDRIGGAAEIADFTPGAGWKEYNGYYYYTLPVKPGKTPENCLLTEYTLQEYDDADGGKQVIEVMAEAIQSEPAQAVGEAWGVTITENHVGPYSPAGQS